MAAKLCKKLQILFGNNMKYSNFIDGKYFLRNWCLKGPHFSKKPHLVKRFTDIFSLKFLISVFVGIINMPENFQKNRWSRSPEVESP